jgi:RHS repeat-associated protein
MNKYNENKFVSFLCTLLLVSTAFVGSPLIHSASSASTNSTNSGGSDDTDSGVDPASGTFHQTIPLLTIPGRGVDIQLNLRYSSRIWEADPDGLAGDNNIAGVPSPLSWNGNHQWLEDYSPVGLGFDLSLGRLYGTRYKCHQTQYPPGTYYWYRFSFENPDGGTIMFVSDNPDYRSGKDDHFIAVDDSGATLLVTWDGDGTNPDSYPTSMTVVLYSGIRYDFTNTGLLGKKDTGFGSHGGTLDDNSGDGSGGGSGAPGLFSAEKFTKIPNDINKPIKYSGQRPTTSWDYWAQQMQYLISRGQMPSFGGGGTHYFSPIIPGVTEETGSASWVATSIRDMNGNVVSITYYSHPDTTYLHFLALPQDITDTYGRTVTFTRELLYNQNGDPQPLFDPNDPNSYPTSRLTDITTHISTTGGAYIIHFTYQNENSDPYQIISTGPFFVEGTLNPRHVATQKGDTDNAQKRVILQSITITPPGPVQLRTTTFGYNAYKELTTITLYTGVQQTINYGCSQIASGYRYGPYGDPYVDDIGTQTLRVVDSTQINAGEGQIACTEYQYGIHTNQNRRPDHICFNKVVELHLGTNKRVEYTYYSNPQWDIIRRESWGEIRNNDEFSALTGLLKSVSTYQDDCFNDNNPGILKQQNQLFYSGVPRIYNHLDPDDTNNQQYSETNIHGNCWQFIGTMGITNWQEGVSHIVIRGIDGYGLHHSDYYPGNDNFAGFRTYWTIQSDDFPNPNQECGNKNIACSIYIANPTHVKIQTTNILYEVRDDEDVNRFYYDRGLGNLLSQINEGEANPWNGNILLQDDVGLYFYLTNSRYPFSYTTIRTTSITYDSTPLINPTTYEPSTVPYYRGLITRQTILQTGEKTDYQYYTNGLPFTTTNYVTNDLYTVNAFHYDNTNQGNNQGMLASTLKYIRINDERYYHDSYGTIYYHPYTTEYHHNPLGQITWTHDDNNNLNEYSYDGYGRQLTHMTNGNIVQQTMYEDNFYGYSFATTTVYAGPNLQDQTITKTLYDTLNRPIITNEKTGDETSWKTFTGITYDANGHITRTYLPSPADQDPIEGRWTNYDSYDIFGRVTQVTDEYGRITTTQIISLTEPVDDHDPNYWLWQLGIRTKTITTGSWGAQTITYSDAQGHTLQTFEKISDDVYANTKYYYDDGGRLLKQISPEGLTTYYYYDSVGRLVATNNPDETADFPIIRGTNYHYPNDDYVDDATADTLTLSWTLSGQPLLVRTAQGFFQYTYDGAGRLLKTEYAATGSDGQPHLPWRLLEENRYGYSETEHLQNTFGRLFRTTSYDTTQNGVAYIADYSYNNQGDMVTETITLGSLPPKTIAFSYDWLGRPTTITYPNNDLIHYSFQGARLSLITLNGQPLADAQYDSYRRLLTLNLGHRNAIETFQYNNQNDQLTSFDVIQDRQTEETIKNPTQSITTNEKINTDIKDSSDTSLLHDTQTIRINLLSENYQYDPASAELTIIRDANNNLKRHYVYDLLGRLTHADLYGVNYQPSTESYYSSPTDTVSIGYGLNKDSLRTSQTIRYNQDPHTETTYVTESQIYNYASGTHRLVKISRNGRPGFSQGYNTAGSVTNFNGNTVTVDCLNQITGYNDENYGYAGGLRVRTNNAQGTIYSLYLGKDVIARYRSDGLLIERNYYGFGQRLATISSGLNGIGYLVNDYHGNVRIIVRNHLVDWQGEYTPFGQVIGKYLPIGQVGFDGYIQGGTVLTYAYGRYYDEKHGEFLSMDPLSTGDNPYSYCSGCPVSKRDPTGLDEKRYIPPPDFSAYRGTGDTSRDSMYLVLGMKLQTADQTDAQRQFNKLASADKTATNAQEQDQENGVKQDQVGDTPDPIFNNPIVDYIDEYGPDICEMATIGTGVLVDATEGIEPLHTEVQLIDMAAQTFSIILQYVPQDTLTIYDSPWNAPFGSGPGPNY